MRRFIRSETYFRAFLILAILFSVAVIPFSLYLTYQFNKYSTQEIERNNRYRLEQTKENFVFVIDSLKRFTLDMYNEPEIRQWPELKQNDPFALNTMVQRLKKTLVNEPFIESVYMINMNLELLFDYQTGMHPLYDFADPEMMAFLSGQHPNHFEIIRHEYEGKSSLALVLPLAQENLSPSSYIVVRLNNDLLQKHLLQAYQETGAYIQIVDKEGKPIIGHADERAMEVLREGKYFSNESALITDAEGSEWLVSYETLDIQEWSIYHLARMDDLFHGVNGFKQKIVYSFSVLLVLLFSILLWNTRRLHLPINKLTQRIFGKLGVQVDSGNLQLQSKTNLRILEHGFELLAEKVDQLNVSIREQKSLIKEDYLRQWVLQGHLNDSLQARLQEMSSILGCPGIAMVAVRIDSYLVLSEKYNFSSRKLLKYAIGNIGTEIMNQKGWETESVDFGGNHVVFLTGLQSDDKPEQLVEGLEEVQRQVMKWLKLHVTIGVSDYKPIDTDLKSVYDEVCQLSTLNFIDGSRRIYQESHWEYYKGMTQPLENEAQQQALIEAIRLGQTDRIEQILDAVRIGMKKLPYEECKLQLTFLIYNLYKTFGQIMLSSSINGIRAELERFDTLDDAMTGIKTDIAEIVSKLQERRLWDRRDERVAEMVDYLQANVYNPALTVEEMADRVSLSASHARSIFKDRTGVTIASYILTERMNKAKYLLVNTNAMIGDIAAQSGFQTKGNFYAVFKKEVGMTPSEYRSQLKE